MPNTFTPEPNTYSLTLHHLELYNNREIAPGLFAAYDADGFLRIHTGEFFRGYVRKSWNRRGELRYGIDVWAETLMRGRVNTHTRFKTLKGAERAIIREAIRLHVGEAK